MLNPRLRFCTLFLTILAARASFSLAGSIVYEARGGTAASLQTTLDGFRLALGPNNGVGGSFAGGRREINWDGIPAPFLDPFPGNFFNSNSARGVVLSTPGSRMKVSGDEGSSSFLFRDVTAQEWGLTEFAFFSPQRFFAPIGSVVTDVTFFVPGTSIPATVIGFGAIFLDVDVANVSKLEFYDSNNRLLLSRFAEPAGVLNKGFSFLGVFFDAGERIARVRITAGTKPIDSPYEIPPPDGVALDDFIFGEPRSAASALIRSAAGPNAAAIQSAVDQFRADLGPLNANVAGSQSSGRREINWDGVPDSLSAPNNLPAGFFNSNSPRGAVFSTPGTGFQVSAKSGNPTSTPVRFGNLHPTYPDTFATFSPERLFTALGSTVTDIGFFVPGSSVPATVSGFGAVFTDVDTAGSATLELFDSNNTSLGSFNVPAAPGSQAFSFLGVSFSAGERISRVRVISGRAGLGANDNPPAADLAVMDDFIYGEPIENRSPRQLVQHLPQVADGQGYQTAIVVNNPAAAFVSGKVEFFGSNGRPISVKIAGKAASSFDFSLAPKAVQRLQTDGSSATLQAGYARVTSDNEIDSLALFQVFDFGNNLITEASVPKAAQLKAFQVFVTTLNNVNTGVAIANTGSQAATISLKLLGAGGLLVSEASLALPAGQHTAKFVSELFPNASGINAFEGALLVNSTVPLAATAVRMQLTPNLTISALPISVVPEP